jgi:hypothetical protein
LLSSQNHIRARGINYSVNIHRNSKKVSDKYPKDERELG